MPWTQLLARGRLTQPVYVGDSLRVAELHVASDRRCQLWPSEAQVARSIGTETQSRLAVAWVLGARKVSLVAGYEDDVFTVLQHLDGNEFCVEQRRRADHPGEMVSACQRGYRLSRLTPAMRTAS